jgi:cytochrome bd-type quinol oxidase subunit 2
MSAVLFWATLCILSTLVIFNRYRKKGTNPKIDKTMRVIFLVSGTLIFAAFLYGIYFVLFLGFPE